MNIFKKLFRKESELDVVKNSKPDFKYTHEPPERLNGPYEIGEIREENGIIFYWNEFYWVTSDATSKSINYFNDENDLTRKMFNLEELLNFQLEYDVQIIRGDDFQYYCYIDREVYATGLTPLFALVCGIKKFHDNLNK